MMYMSWHSAWRRTRVIRSLCWRRVDCVFWLQRLQDGLLQSKLDLRSRKKAMAERLSPLMVNVKKPIYIYYVFISPYGAKYSPLVDAFSSSCTLHHILPSLAPCTEVSHTSPICDTLHHHNYYIPHHILHIASQCETIVQSSNCSAK